MKLLQAYKANIQEKLVTAYISKNYFNEKNGIKLKNNTKQWEQYKDATDVKDEWFNISDNTENFIAELVMYDLPTIIVSGGIAGIAGKISTKGIRAGLTKAGIESTGYGAKSALFMGRAASEGLVFTASYDAIRYKSWFLNNPEWGKHVALNTFFFGAARILGMRKFTSLEPHLEGLIKTGLVLPAAVVMMDLALSYKKVLNADPDLKNELISEFLVLSILGGFLHLAPSAITGIKKGKIKVEGRKFDIEIDNNGKGKINGKEFKLTEKAKEKLKNKNKIETKVEAKAKIKELEIQVEKINTELTSINNKVGKASFMTKKLVSRLQEYKTEINKLKSEKTVKTRDLEILESKIKSSKQEVKTLKEVIDDIETELAIKDSELKISESYLEIAQSRAKKLTQELSKSKTDIGSANKRIDILEKSLKHNKELLEKANKSSKDGEYFSNKVVELEINIKELKQNKVKLTELEQSIKEKQQENRELTKKLQEQQTEKTRLNENLEKTNQTIKLTKQELTKAKNELEVSKKEGKLKNEELSLKEQQVNDLYTRLENFRKLKDEYSKIKNELKAKEKELGEMLDSLRVKDEQVFELEQKNISLINDIRIANENLKILQNNLIKIKEIGSKRYSEVEQQIKNKNKEIENLRKVEKEYDGVRVELKKSEEQISDLTKQILKNNDIILKQRQQIEFLDSRFGKLNKQLEQAKQNLARFEIEGNKSDTELKIAMVKIDFLEKQLRDLLQTRVPNLENNLEKEKIRELDFSKLKKGINTGEELAKKANNELDSLLRELESI